MGPGRRGSADRAWEGSAIFELRTAVGGYAGRVLYFFRDGGTAVLTHGFAKRGRKTPRREIERAKRYRSDDLGREGFA